MELDIDTEIAIKNAVIAMEQKHRKIDISRRIREVTRQLEQLKYWKDLKNGRKH